MNEEHETIDKYSALSKMQLSNKEQEEIWNQVQQRMMQSTPHKVSGRRSHIFETSAAVIATIAVIAGGMYAYVNHRSVERPRQGTIASKHSLPKFPAPAEISSLYTSDSAQIKWITQNKNSATQEVLGWLKSATLYAGTVPKTEVVVASYVGPAQVHIQTTGNKEISIFPANHIVLDKGQYKPVYVPNVIGYSTGNHTAYLQSAQLYNWLKNGDWKNTFDIPMNPLFRTSLTLPNGQTITPYHSSKWKELNVSLQILNIPQAQPRYDGIIGNHSTVLSHTTVSTSAGKATLVLNKRTPPAASQSSTPTYEYWVIVYGSQYAYAIEATITGSVQSAKTQLMPLLHGWKVPK